MDIYKGQLPTARGSGVNSLVLWIFHSSHSHDRLCNFCHLRLLLESGFVGSCRAMEFHGAWMVYDRRSTLHSRIYYLTWNLFSATRALLACHPDHTTSHPPIPTNSSLCASKNSSSNPSSSMIISRPQFIDRTTCRLNNEILSLDHRRDIDDETLSSGDRVLKSCYDFRPQALQDDLVSTIQQGEIEITPSSRPSRLTACQPMYGLI